MPVRDHTYFIAHRGWTLGRHADDARLSAALSTAWSQHAAGAEPGPVDGVAVWRDDDGAIQCRLVRLAAVTTLADDALTACARDVFGAG